MPRCQYKNIVNDYQNNVSPVEPSNLTTVGPEKSNISEVKERDFKIASMNMLKINLKRKFFLIP